LREVTAAPSGAGLAAGGVLQAPPAQAVRKEYTHAMERLSELAFRAYRDLVYETPNLRSIQLMQQGAHVYDRAVYEHNPWWLTPYTPLYHHLVALFPANAAKPFLPGRW
jgi:hypothetical protein